MKRSEVERSEVVVDLMYLEGRTRHALNDLKGQLRHHQEPFTGGLALIVMLT